MKGQGLTIGLRFPPGRCNIGACLWHRSHLLTYSTASRCIFDHQNPWVMARCASDLPPEWPPHTPSRSSANNLAILLGWRHNRYGFPNESRYSLPSSDNQKWVAILHFFSTSFVLFGKDSLDRKAVYGSNQLSSSSDETSTTTCGSMLGHSNISTIIIQGMQSFKEDDNVEKELAWLFWLLGTLTILTFWRSARKLSNICKYYDMRRSLALKLPSIWLTIESENISTSFAPKIFTAWSLAMRASYFASLFKAQKPSLSDLSNLTPSGDTNTISTLHPLALKALYTNTFYWNSLSADFNTNLFSAAIILISFWTSFGLLGGCSHWMAVIWLGFTSMPRVVIIYPKNLPDPTPMAHFLALRHNLCYFKNIKNTLQVMSMLPFLPHLNYHVININLHCLADQFLKHTCDHPLICSPRILQPKRHYCVMIIPLEHYKDSLFLILGGQCYLMIALECIQKAHSSVPDCSVH